VPDLSDAIVHRLAFATRAAVLKRARSAPWSSGGGN